ncbi:MAG: DUF2723 domain-containing protein [Kiritimatiellia bacterium]
MYHKFNLCLKHSIRNLIQQCNFLRFGTKAEFNTEWRIKNVLFFMLIGLTTFLYLATTGNCIYPGPSAVSMAKIAGLLPEIKTTHPLWMAISKIIYLIPLSSPVIRLNYFSVVCGIVSIYLLFQISSMLIYEQLFDKNKLGFIPYNETEETDTDEKPYYGYPGNTPFCDKQIFIAVNFGAFLCTLAFCFSAPFWIASTSFHLMSFQTLLFLITLYLSLKFALYGNIFVGVFSFIFLGITFAESGLYIIPLIFLFAYIIKQSVQFDFFSDNLLLLFLLTFCIGLVLNFSLLFSLQSLENGFVTGDIIPLLQNLAKSHIKEIRLFLPKRTWLIILIQSILPLIITTKGLQSFFSYKAELLKWKWFILFLVISILSCYTLLNLPGAAWQIAREGNYLPVFNYICVSLTVGNLCTYWILLILAKTQKGNSKKTKLHYLMFYGALICSFFIGTVVFLQIPLNINDCKGKNAEFMDKVCNLILEESAQSETLITDGIFDMNLILVNHFSNKKVRIARIPPIRHASVFKELQDKTNMPFFFYPTQIKSKKDVNIDVFLSKWIQHYLKQDRNIACMRKISDLPDSLSVTPYGLIYKIQKTHPQIKNHNYLLKNHLAEVKKTQSALNSSNPSRPILKNLHNYLQTHLSHVSNHLGIFYENNKDSDKALQAYKLSEKIHPDNIEATFNLFGYYLKNGPEHEALKYTEKLLRYNKTKSSDDSDLQTAINRIDLQKQAPDIIFPLAVRLAEKHHIQAQKILKLLKNWHQIYTPFTPSSERISLSALMNKKEHQHTPYLSKTMKMILKGENKRAINLLSHYIYKNPENMAAWSLITQAHLNNNELEKIKNNIIPSIRKACTNNNNVMIYMIEGCYNKSKQPPALHKARSCFLKALECKEHPLITCSELLYVDKKIGSADILKEDAKKILAKHPDHAEANLLIGNYYLSQNDLNLAKHHLEKSLSTQKSFSALNDLAELYRRQKKMPQAEFYARKAIKVNPYYSQAWDTLSNILMNKKHFEEAEQCIKVAIHINPDSRNPYLTFAEILIHRKDSKKAEMLINQIAPLIDEEDQYLLKKFNKINRSLM